jgi:hypothetical protein
VPEVLGKEGRADQSGLAFRYEELGLIEVRDREVLIGGKLALKTYALAQAEAIQGLLAQLRDANPEDRPALIYAALNRSLDATEIDSLLLTHAMWDRPLRLLTNLLTLHLLVITPVAIFRLGVIQTWFWIVPIALVLILLIAVLFYAAHRALYPKDLGGRLQHLLLIVGFPPAACRAHDALALDLLSTFHPVAVGTYLLAGDTRLTWISERVRDFAYAYQPEAPTDAVTTTVTEFRNLQRAFVSRFLASQEIDVTGLEQNPPSRDAGAMSYCPRCHGTDRPVSCICTTCGQSPRAIVG